MTSNYPGDRADIGSIIPACCALWQATGAHADGCEHDTDWDDILPTDVDDEGVL